MSSPSTIKKCALGVAAVFAIISLILDYPIEYAIALAAAGLCWGTSKEAKDRPELIILTGIYVLTAFLAASMGIQQSLNHKDNSLGILLFLCWVLIYKLEAQKDDVHQPEPQELSAREAIAASEVAHTVINNCPDQDSLFKQSNSETLKQYGLNPQQAAMALSLLENEYNRRSSDGTK